MLIFKEDYIGTKVSYNGNVRTIKDCTVIINHPEGSLFLTLDNDEIVNAKDCYTYHKIEEVK